jgi:hypothetical protein
MMPEQFPIVNCSPVPVVRFPYLGLLLGSHANGRPTITYRPMATIKQAKYLTPLPT